MWRIKDDDKLSTQLAGYIRFFVNAAGLTGIFAGIGYIAFIAHQEFLGIKLDITNIVQLSFYAAAFCYDTLCVIIEQIQVHYLIVSFVILIIVLIIMIRNNVRRLKNVNAVCYEIFVIFIVIFMSVYSLVLYELPCMQIRDVFIGEMSSQRYVQTKNIIANRTKIIWSWIDIAKSGDNDSNFSKPGDQNDQNKGSVTAKQAECKLKDGYAIVFMSAVIGWLLIFKVEGLLAGRFYSSFRIVSVILLSFETLLIPYIYGKVIATTDMPYVSIILQVRNEPMTISNGAKDTQELFSGEKKLERDNLILAEKEKSIVVLNIDKNTGFSYLIDIPKTRVIRVETYKIVDALKEQRGVTSAPPTGK